MRLFVTGTFRRTICADILNLRTYTEAAFGTKEITCPHASDGIKIQACPTARRWRSKIWRCSFGQCVWTCFKQQSAKLNILGRNQWRYGFGCGICLRGKKGAMYLCCRPDGKMSAFQRAQMYACKTGISTIRRSGMFDDCQDIVEGGAKRLRSWK